MQQVQKHSELHLNWDAIVILIAVPLVSTGMWGAAIGALMAWLR